jgi:hypothetical protein
MKRRATRRNSDPMLERLDSVLLHPWLQRLGSVGFLVGVVTFATPAIANGIHDVGLWGFVGIALMAAGLLVLVLGWKQRRNAAATAARRSLAARGTLPDRVSAQLREGNRLLAILRANSPDLAAATEQEVEVWWQSVRSDLPADLRGRFELAAPWPHGGRAWDRLGAVLDGGTRCLDGLLGEMPRGPGVSETQDRGALRELLREGLRLRGTLDLWPDPDAERQTNDDPVFDWTRRTWEVLERDSPLVAQQFFGHATAYAAGYLMTAYAIEIGKNGRRAFLDRRIKVLSSVSEHEDHPPRQSSWTPPMLRPGNALVKAMRDTTRERRAPTVERLRGVADRIEAHVDARQVEEPRWEPTVWDAGMSEVTSPRKAEHRRELASYRQETIALYIKGDRAEALAAVKDAMALLGNTDTATQEVVRMPDGIPQLTLVPDVLRKAANRLAEDYEPRPVSAS